MHGVDAARGGQVEVALPGPAPYRQPARQPQRGDGPDVGDFLVAHGGSAHLEFLHAGVGEQPGDGQFFRPGEGHPRRLLAVAKRGIDEPHACVVEFAGHGSLRSIHAVSNDGMGLPSSRASRISSIFCSVTSWYHNSLG